MRTDAAVRLTLLRTIGAEWLKLRTLRSFQVCVAAAPALAAGGAVLAVRAGTDVLSFAAAALQIALVFLAVLAVSCEYTGGAIRVSLIAVPRKRVLMAAKAAVVTGVATVLAGLALPLVYVTAGPYGTMQALLGVEIGYCVLVALFAFTVALAVRHTAAAAGLTLGVLLLLRVVL